MADLKSILTERISKYVHEGMWMVWTAAMIEKGMVAKETADRWNKLHVPYEELSDEEKDKDRFFANGIINEISKEVEDGNYVLSVLPSDH